MAASMQNFHVPLPPGLYRELQDEASLTGRPATALAREAIGRWLEARRRAGVREAISAYSTELAGTEADLDRDLEAVAIESLLQPEVADR